jgi:hypothetical protein
MGKSSKRGSKEMFERTMFEFELFPFYIFSLIASSINSVIVIPLLIAMTSAFSIVQSLY